MTPSHTNNSVILTPYFLDQPVAGLSSLAGPEWKLNTPSLTGSHQQTRLSQIHQALAEQVEETITTGKRPVSIAGDCCTAIGVLAGLQRAGIAPNLIWFDAHGDFNTMDTTPSGFLGGMPLAMIAGKGDPTLPRAVALNHLPEENIILTDGRDLDPPERELIESSAITHLPDVQTLLGNPLPGDALYIHFDVDVVALEESPAQNYPAQGGPSVACLDKVFRHLASTGRIAAISVSTWNPELDPDSRSEDVSMALLQTLAGGPL